MKLINKWCLQDIDLSLFLAINNTFTFINNLILGRGTKTLFILCYMFSNDPVKCYNGLYLGNMKLLASYG